MKKPPSPLPLSIPRGAAGAMEREKAKSKKHPF